MPSTAPASVGASRVVGSLVRVVAIAADFFALFAGFILYLLSGRTPRISFHSMRRLYGPTRGSLNRALLALLRWIRPAAKTGPVEGFLGTFSESEIISLARQIESDGYAPLGRAVPADLCVLLKKFASTQSCVGMGKRVAAVYSEQDADALRYDFHEDKILSNAAACRMVFDGTLASIAAAYFKCQPIYDFCAMWWTTGQGEKAYAEAAQKFHFDMDRPFFLKFFVYLTDVSEITGPHVYVIGSHINKPALLRVPRRFEDEEVEAHYSPSEIKAICGPTGTIFAVDTSGLHKGLPVIAGHRLAFQIEFTVSKFGQNYPPASVSEQTLREAGVSLPLDRRVFGNVLGQPAALSDPGA